LVQKEELHPFYPLQEACFLLSLFFGVCVTLHEIPSGAIISFFVLFFFVFVREGESEIHAVNQRLTDVPTNL